LGEVGNLTLLGKRQMKRLRATAVGNGLWVLIAFTSGCALPAQEHHAGCTAAHQECLATAAGLAQTIPAHQTIPSRVELVAAEGRPDFAGVEELTEQAVVDQVIARNPTLAQMAAAYDAAAARFPQVTSLDDPMLTGALAPASLGSNRVDAGYRVEVAQKFPYPGKLQLRGQTALAEASAAGNDVEDMKLQLIESAKAAFYDYYLVDRARAVNEEGLKLLNEIRQDAFTRFKNGQTPEQDFRQADVEIGKQRERGLLLERMRRVTIARLNTLMNLPVDSPLPRAPQTLEAIAKLPEADRLRSLALARRPDLKALADRVAGEEAALALAQKEYYPDFEASAAYDSIMGNGPARDLAPQVGLRLNMPLRRSRRSAGVLEAQARLAQRSAELISRTNQINLQVQEAYEQLVESEKVIGLYDKTILPAAKENARAAQAAYAATKVPILSLVEAQRNLVNLRDRQYEAMADYFRRRATLERVIGGPLPTVETTPSIPSGPK